MGALLGPATQVGSGVRCHWGQGVGWFSERVLGVWVKVLLESFTRNDSYEIKFASVEIVTTCSTC